MPLLFASELLQQTWRYRAPVIGQFRLRLRQALLQAFPDAGRGSIAGLQEDAALPDADCGGEAEGCDFTEKAALTSIEMPGAEAQARQGHDGV